MIILDLLKSSLRAIQVLAPGRTPNQSETIDALTVLNAMLRSWSTHRLIVHAIARRSFDLGPADSYTIGPGGDLAVAERPVKIEAAALACSGAEGPYRVYDHLGPPTREGLYYKASWPLGVLTPYPSFSSAQTLILYTREVFAEITDPDADLEFPPGYEDAIRYNLAVRLAPEWGGRVAPDAVVDLARTSLAFIMSDNLPRPELTIDPALTSTYGGGV